MTRHHEAVCPVGSGLCRHPPDLPYTNHTHARQMAETLQIYDARMAATREIVAQGRNPVWTPTPARRPLRPLQEISHVYTDLGISPGTIWNVRAAPPPPGHVPTNEEWDWERRWVEEMRQYKDTKDKEDQHLRPWLRARVPEWKEWEPRPAPPSPRRLARNRQPDRDGG